MSHVCDKKDEYKSTPKFTFKRNECCLCPNGWLPLQRSKCNRWVHPQCVMFIGEAFFEQGKKADLNSIDPERMKLRCELCAEHANASNDKFPCIQCDAHDCTRAFHVTCAQQKGFSRMILDTSTGQVVCKTFCPAHLHRFTQNQHNSRSNEKKNVKKNFADHAIVSQEMRNTILEEVEKNIIIRAKYQLATI